MAAQEKGGKDSGSGSGKGGPASAPLLPWRLLFSRTGKHPADGGEQEISYAALEESRMMTEQEGRSAFRFWIAGGAALCLMVAIGAVSCAHREAGASSGDGRTFWIAVLVLVLAVILTVAAVDFARAWKAQKDAGTGRRKTVFSTAADVLAGFKDRLTPDAPAGKAADKAPQRTERQNEGQ